MFANYLKTALRNIMRQKLFSFINIVGLAIGLAAFILIVLFVRDEMSWDQHWDRADDIYRLETTLQYPRGSDRFSPSAAAPLKEILLDTIQEVEAVTRFVDVNVTVRHGADVNAQIMLFVDNNFIEFFDFPFMEGSRETAFATINSIVISQSTAQRYFGENTALGRIISARLGGEFRDFTVGGVIENPRSDTHLRHDFLVPMNREYFANARWFTEDWRFLVHDTYIRFAPETNISAMRAALPAVVSQHKPTIFSNGQEDRRNVMLHLVPIQDTHLHSHIAAADPDVLFGFLAVAFLILMIAVANFLNLSMARTAYRAREVALRKVVGARRAQIIQQFLGESVILVFVSMLIALVLVEVSLPYYNEFLSAFVTLDFINQTSVLMGLLLLCISIGLAAGSFQAFYFAVLKPRDVLYSNTAADNGTSMLRTGLVVAQFAISIALMTFAFFVTQQTKYARTLDIGFNAEEVIIVGGTNNDRSEIFKTRLLESPHITAVGRSSDVPTEGSEDRVSIIRALDGEALTMDGLTIGPDFFNAYEIPLLAGRYLTQNEADAARLREDDGDYKPAINIVVNASGAELLGYSVPDAAINQTITTDLYANWRVDATIVGVVDDFHFDSARAVIRPGLYYVFEPRQSVMSVRAETGARAEAIEEIEEIWREIYPENFLYYRTMLEMVEQQYQNDEQLAVMVSAFTLLAVVISCLGLYGLASFTVERRTREIGLRKILGASVKDVIGLLLWQFAKPILVANLIAWPVAFYFISDWLNSFAYRIDLDPAPFVLTGGLALIIGWLTVAGHAFLVARANPINALRYE